ncbi:MAG: RNA polymerase-binding protein DksA [Thermodesulfobacteriota bacterium]|nr:MAG: RNA polymerase-binding protein DksA [Thermodesulfobacteriota bacterium]
MEQAKTKHFRKILNKRLEALLSEAEKTVTGMSGYDGDHFPDPSDRASHETDTSFLLRVKDRERKLISKVKEALERLDNGTYGVCDLCGEDISEERLEVRPVTTCCIECKKEEEEHEKNLG